jgi:predicted lipid-binding transport protein (Tim44 family)
VPAGFDTEAFLRHAKASFIRMQAAWDRSDVNDLREFTTPEVFAELQLQIQERGGNPTTPKSCRSTPSCWASKPPNATTWPACSSTA